MDVVTSTPKARKEHTCIVCRATIQPGETYTRHVTFDGGAYTWKNCTPCDDAIQGAWRDGYDDGGTLCAEAVIEWADEHKDEQTAAAALCARTTKNRETNE